MRFALFAALLGAVPTFAQPQRARPAPLPDAFSAAPAYTCPDTCVLPACRCASTRPPGGLAPDRTPQLVVVTFDDCVQPQTEALIRPLLDGVRNPTGDPAPATYFLSLTGCPLGGTTDAATVRARAAAGDEMALHTVTHTTSSQTDFATWRREIVGVERYLDSLGIGSARRGFRAPYVATNAALFDVLESLGALYDASIYESPFFSPVSDGPERFLWPYTLDYGPAQNCSQWADFNACTDDPKPGLWSLPLYYHVDVSGDGTQPDDYLGTFDVGNPVFSFGPRLTGDALFEALASNFDARYRGNRAPYGLFLHAATLEGGAFAPAYARALRYMAAQPDTWFVTAQQLIAWMRAPVPASEMAAWLGPAATPVAADAPAAPTPLRVYPTLTTGTVTVTGVPAGTSAHVFDALGRRVLGGAAPGRLDLSGLPPGRYFVRAAGHTRAVTLRR